MISVLIPECIIDFLTILPFITPTKKNAARTDIVEYTKASELSSTPIIIKIINGTNGISHIKLNPTNVLTELSIGFLVSSINPNSSFIIVSIHTFFLDVIIRTTSSNNSSLNPFFM